MVKLTLLILLISLSVSLPTQVGGQVKPPTTRPASQDPATTYENGGVNFGKPHPPRSRTPSQTKPMTKAKPPTKPAAATPAKTSSASQTPSRPQTVARPANANEGIITPPNGGPSATIYSKEGYTNEYCRKASVSECFADAWKPAGERLKILRRVNVHDAPAADNDEVLSYYEVEYEKNGKPLVGFVPIEYLTVADPTKIKCIEAEYNMVPQIGRLQKDLGKVIDKAIQAPPRQPPKEVQDKMLFPRLADRRWFNSRCDNFMDGNGNLGDWGRMVKTAINEINPGCIYNDMNMAALCPNFSKMSQKDKEYFMIYLFSTMGQKESSCRPWKPADPSVDNPNGLAIGLTQVEADPEVRKKQGRDPRYCPHHPIDNFDPRFQIFCAVSILSDTQCQGKGRAKRSSTKPLIGGHSYWHGLLSTTDNDERYVTIAEELIRQPFPRCR